MSKETSNKSKKNKDAKVSYYQAITSYKITNKQKEIQAIKDDLRDVEELNKNFKKRNQRLIDQKNQNMHKVLEEYKAYKNQLNSEKGCEREEVVGEMKELWKLKRSKDKDLLNIRREIREVEKEIHMLKRELHVWNNFRSQGTNMLTTQIALLKKELLDMHQNYEIISNNLRISLNNYIQTIEKTTHQTIEHKNKKAASRAFKEMDKETIEMSYDNKWMKEKIDLYKKEYQQLVDSTSDIENENIELMNYLFNCSSDEIKYVRNIFSTQFLDNENLDKTNIMSVDISNLESVRSDDDAEAAIKKMRDVNLKNSLNNQLCIQSSSDVVDQKYLNLGSLDYKTLILNGIKKEIISESNHSEKEARNFDYSNEEWPISQEMLTRALTN